LTIGSAEAETIFEGFLDLMEKMERQIKEIEDESRRSNGILVQMGGLLQLLYEPIREFRKIVKALLAIGFTTRIESGAVGSCVGDFEGLAYDVKRLAEVIGEKSSTILEELSILEHQITAVIQKMQSLQGDASQNVRKRVENTKTLTLALMEKRLSLNENTEFLAENTFQISRHIGEIVASIQFHDIVRQKVEHVQMALERLQKEIYEAGGADDSSAHLIAGEICRIQIDQLRNAETELRDAVQKIVESLREVGLNVNEMASETMRISGAADHENTTFFSQMEPAFDFVRSMLAATSEVNQQSSNLIGSVVGRIADLSYIVDEIEIIGAEMKVVASNAGIRAAHAGGNGASLGVISDAVQSLSGEALFQTMTLAREFREISVQASGLKQSLEDGRASREENISELEHKGKESFQFLHGLNEEFLSLLGGIREEADSLSKDLLVAGSSLNVHEKGRETIESVIAGLKNFSTAEREPEAMDGLRDSSVFQEIMERYTMESEREIHEKGSVLRNLFSSEKNNSFLFKEEDADPLGLGANVELF